MPAVNVEGLKEALEKLEKKELIKIVCDFARRDTERTAKLMLSLEGDETQELELCIKRIAAAFQQKKKYHMYDGAALKRAMKDVAKRAYAHLGEEPMAAFELYFLIITEYCGADCAIFDNSGSLSDYISAIFNEIRDITEAENLESEDAGFIHTSLMKFAREERHEYSCVVSAFSVLASMSRDAETRDAVNAAIMSKMAEWKHNDNIFASYSSDQLKEIQFKMLKKFDGDKAAMSFANKNLQNYSFRVMAANEAREAGDWKRLLEIAKGKPKNGEGIALTEWDDVILEAYTKLGDKANILKTTEHLMMYNNFDTYYPKVKALFDEKDWEKYFAKLCKELQGTERWMRLIAIEKMEPEIMKECTARPWLLFSYYHLLDVKKYGDRMENMFRQYITKEAERRSTRKGYAEIRDYLRAFENACGEPAEQLRQALLKKYSTKPAYREELSR